MSVGNLGLPSVLRIKIGNQSYVLTSSEMIKSGGEAAIFLLKLSDGKRVAVKIIFPSMRSPHRTAKLKAMINRTPSPPSKTMRPLSLVTDDSNEIIGFTMDLLERSQYDELSFWMKPDWRDINGIKTEDVLAVFGEIRKELASIHKNGYVVGDFNPGGILVMKKALWSQTNNNDRIRFVDVDSFAFDSFGCLVYTLAYLDYKIAHRTSVNGIDLPKGFSAKNDVFAFNALFFETLTNVNVYDGYSPTLMSVNPKINFEKGWTVLHPNIEYPDDVNVVPFKSLPDNFRGFFEKAFLTSERVLFPEHILSGNNAVVFHDVVTQERQVVLTQSPQGFSRLQDLLQFKLNDKVHVLDVAILEGGVHILYRSNAISKNQMGYMVYANNAINEYLFDCEHKAGSEWVIVSAYMVAQVVKKPNLSEVDVYAVRKPLHRNFLTANGIMGKPIFAGGNNELYTATTTENIVAHTLSNADDANWRYIQPVSPRTTEIKSDVESGNLAGYTRIMSIYTWFFVRGANSYNVRLPQLADTESMIDWSVRFTGNRACVVRLTEYKGVRRMYIDEINLSTVYNEEQRIINSRLADTEFFKPVNGFEYGMNKQGDGMLFYATHRGLVKENLQTGQTVEFPQTKGIVKSGMKIRRYGDGLIVYSNTNILYVKF